MKQRYVILYGDADALAQYVSEKLGEGYVLAGPLTCSPASYMWYQPMILLECTSEMAALRLVGEQDQ